MDDFVGGVIVGLIVALILVVFAVRDINSGRVSDCDNFGAFMVDDVKYECRRADK